MENTMFVVSEIKIDELIKNIQLLNDNLQNLAVPEKSKEFLTREQVADKYDLSVRATTKIFNVLLRDKVIDIGKTQKICQTHIEDLFEQGVKLK